MFSWTGNPSTQGEVYLAWLTFLDRQLIVFIIRGDNAAIFSSGTNECHVDPTPKSGAGEADSVILTAGSLLLLGRGSSTRKDEGGRQEAFRSPSARRGPSALPGQVLGGRGRSLGSTQPSGPRAP